MTDFRCRLLRNREPWEASLYVFGPEESGRYVCVSVDTKTEQDEETGEAYPPGVYLLYSDRKDDRFTKVVTLRSPQDWFDHMAEIEEFLSGKKEVQNG